MAAPKLRIVDPPHEPAVFEIPEGGSTIGRGGECTFTIAAKSVSRVHARFERRGESLSLEDLGSRNGTRVNERALSGVIELHPGDRIRFGAVETIVEEEAEEIGETVLAPGGETVLAKPPPMVELPEAEAAPAPSRIERSGATATSTVEQPTGSAAAGPSAVELALIALAAYAVVVGAGLVFWRGF